VGSDSKKFRRISDKSEDNQRFFKNLIDLPNSNAQAAAIKVNHSTMGNIESTNPVNMGSRGQLPLNMGSGYKPSPHNPGVVTMGS
jgi:hypothetical protein